jgi:hypothetical protein
MNIHTKQDLIKLLSYVYRDERDDYESYDDDSSMQDNHIFTSILGIMRDFNIDVKDLNA